MLKTRLFATSVGVLAAATFALAGCGDKTQEPDTTTPTTSVPQVGAKEAFIDAANKLNDQTVKAEMTMDGLVSIKSTTQMDPVGKKANATMDMTVGGIKVTTSVLSVNGEVWVKMSGIPNVSDKWMHAPADKVKAGSSLDPTKDIGADFATGVVDVERDGANGFKGTIDLTKVSAVPAEAVKQLGDKAKAVPFTATVDAEGRLITLNLDMNSIVPGAGKMMTAYSGFGDPVTVTPPPAGEVVEMPADVLDSMNKV